MKWTGLLVLLIFILHTHSAPPKKVEVGAMEIDFSPLDKATAESYTVTVIVKSEDGSSVRIPVKASGSPKSPQIAETVDSALPDGWARSLKVNKLTIRSFKGSPVKSIQILLEGEVAAIAPTVMRLRPKTKK